MKIPFRQSWRLRGIERRLRRSEPHLTVMLAIFARLADGEAIISREQAPRFGHWVRPVLAVLAGVIAGFAAAWRWVSGAAARLCAAARRRQGRMLRAPFSRPSAAGSPPGPRRSLGS